MSKQARPCMLWCQPAKQPGIPPVNPQPASPLISHSVCEVDSSSQLRPASCRQPRQIKQSRQPVSQTIKSQGLSPTPWPRKPFGLSALGSKVSETMESTMPSTSKRARPCMRGPSQPALARPALGQPTLSPPSLLHPVSSDLRATANPLVSHSTMQAARTCEAQPAQANQFQTAGQQTRPPDTPTNQTSIAFRHLLPDQRAVGQTARDPTPSPTPSFSHAWFL